MMALAPVPSSSLDSFSSQAPSDVSINWYALKIRAGGEERIVQSLRNKGHDLFLPTTVESRCYSDRVKKINVPLFAGYAFCQLDIEQRLPILQGEGVEHFVGIGKIPVPIPNEEIAALQVVVAAALPAQPWPYLKSGDAIRIQVGAFAALTGLLLSFRGSDRLVLSVHLLQRSVSVEIDRSWVRPDR